jgi:primary-amine oxidase
LDPLSPDEIASAVQAIREHIAVERPDKDYRVWYKSIQLLDAPKAILAPYLDKGHAACDAGETVEALDRKAEAIVGIKAAAQCTWYG